jgi:hypothetical protein
MAEEIMFELGSGEGAFRPSWVDRLTDWIDGLPVPQWVFYLVVYVLGALLLHLASWLEGSQRFGRPQLESFLDALFLPYILALIHYLDRAASRALAKIRPLLDTTDDEFAGLRFQLTTMRANVVCSLTIAVILITALIGVVRPQGLLPDEGSPVAIGLLLILFALGWLTVPILLYHTVRQLRIVSILYSHVKHINLFNLQPLEALSGLAFRTALGWVILLNLSLLLNFVLLSRYSLTFVITLIVLELIMAFLAFVLPVWDFHVKLREEKGRLREENSQRLEVALDELHRRMDEDNTAGMADFHSGIRGLLAFQTELDKVSTWPWRATTVRGLASAVFLPILLLVIQQVLVRIMGN